MSLNRSYTRVDAPTYDVTSGWTLRGERLVMTTQPHTWRFKIRVPCLTNTPDFLIKGQNVALFIAHNVVTAMQTIAAVALCIF